MMAENDPYVTRKELSDVTDGINAKLDRLGEKLDGKTQPNWAVIWSALGVGTVLIIAVAGGSWAIVNSQIGSVHQVVESFDMRMQRIENMSDSDKNAKARMWDDYMFSKLTRSE